MSTQINHSNEQLAAQAFTHQSFIFDELYAGNGIIRYKRDRVRKCLLQYLRPGSTILELNAGTGDDAIFFAQNGYSVHATDISAGMQKKLMEKVKIRGLTSSISNELCCYTGLEALKSKGPYDCIFSNFAGLNCTSELSRVLAGFDHLIRPGGIVIVVLLPGFCLWESLMILKGKFKTATRRFFCPNGRRVNIDGNSFKCWYYPPGVVTHLLKDRFELLEIEGLCTIVPPSYLENFAEKYPGIFSFLRKAENRLKSRWPWKYIGDYYIISFRKKS